jgi:(R,R)-butanediol dehydrogenase/meso-butanediol dehydrogenase/diacetyl reductase
VRAAVYHGARDIRIAELETAAPRHGEVTVEVAYCGICGSDLHEYVDGPHAIPVGEPHPASGTTAPLVLGHEFCGTVTVAGPGVTGFAPGDRVAVEPNYRCGTCPRCLAGDYHICRHFGFAGLMGNGGLAECATVPAYMLHRLPDAVSFEQAALFEPAAVALHALRRSGADRNTTVAVVGLGPIGLLTVRLLVWLRVPRIVAVDMVGARLRLAGELGATDLVHPGGEETVAERIRELTGGEGVDIAFEIVGAQDTVRTCLAATRKGGKVILVGLAGELCVDGFALVNNEQSIIASVGYRECHQELIRLVAEEGVDLSPIVTATIGLDEVVSGGFEALLGGSDQIKILVRPKGIR